MAEIVYEVLQKPLDVRLVEAACIYYEVDREFFYVKKKDAYTEKRRVLFLLLREDAGWTDTAIANAFGHGQSSIYEGLNLQVFRRSYCQWITHDMNHIRRIAANLEARFVTVNVKLEMYLGGGGAVRENGG